MPEEINRLVADSLAQIHFCASQTAVKHLAAEGIRGSAFWVGDVMLDVMLQTRHLACARSRVMSRLQLTPGDYALVTIHRVANTDNPSRLRQIVQAINGVAERVVFPVHPRTRAALEQLGAVFGSHVQLEEPVSYFDMIVLEENARLIATDSGGVQREAYFLGVPCLTLRDKTEWVETVQTGWNRLVGTDPQRVLDAWHWGKPEAPQPPIFGDGQAARRIAESLTDDGGSQRVLQAKQPMVARQESRSAIEEVGVRS
jgi:UDP-GlcNAc3NAcA epimerase